MSEEKCYHLDDYESRLTRCKAEIDGKYESVLDAMVDIREAIDEVIENQQAQLKAFPEEDVRMHKEWHEAVMKREARKEQLYNAIIEKSLAGLVWAAIVFIGTLVWEHISKR